MGWCGGVVANYSPLLLLLLSLLSLYCLSSAIVLSFLTTSLLAPVASPDHNSAAQGENKQASA